MEFTTIASGSSGNCIYIKGGNTTLLIDVGCAMKHVCASLHELGSSIEDIDAILVTHEHSDHINMVAQLSKKYHIPVYASELTWESLPFYDDYFRWERHIFDYGMEIGDIGLDFFRLSHDAVQPVGLLLEHNGHQVGIATDTGMVTPSMYRKLSNVDGLVFEANHDTAMLRHGTYPLFLKQRVSSDKGHLSNAQAAEALAKLAGPKTKHIILAHLSEKNNMPQLALQEVSNAFTSDEGTPNISIAPRRAAHPLIAV